MGPKKANAKETAARPGSVTEPSTEGPPPFDHEATGKEALMVACDALEAMLDQGATEIYNSYLAPKVRPYSILMVTGI